MLRNGYKQGKPIKSHIMAKKSAISGEYIITQEDSGTIRVCKIYDNVIGSLREIAAANNYTIEPKWNTQDAGRHICKDFGDGTMAQIGEYTIVKRSGGRIESYRTYANTIAALREISAHIGFKADSKWNTQQFGSKLIDFING